MSQFINPQTKKSIQDVVFPYKNRRDRVFSDLGINENDYKDQAAKLRKKVFDDFGSRLKIAKENLAANGFAVSEAKDASELRQQLLGIIGNTKKVVKSKSNTGREMKLEQLLSEQGIRHFETDLGDYIIELFKEEDMHYVLPALHLAPQMIAEKIKHQFADDVAAQADELTHYLCSKIRENILQAEVGITGANFFTQSGQVALLENEGNISLISRLPKKHIIICGIDKLVESVQDAVHLCQTAAIFGTGQKITQYISVISGPSKTADIQNELVLGAQGAKEVHVILVDNGRSRLIGTVFEDMLRCINCGACINFCPAYHNLGKKYGGTYLGIKGIILETFLSQPTEGEKADNGHAHNRKEVLLCAKRNGSFDCTLCGNCSENCPMQIPLNQLLRRIRNKQNEKGIQTDANSEMAKNIDCHGNPFGELSQKEIPDKLYCC